MRRTVPLVVGSLALVLLGGCGGGGRKPVADPRVGRAFYLCCNLRYDPQKPEIEDGLAAGSAMIPFATRVEIQKVTKDSVQFEAAGRPPITLTYDRGDSAVPFDQHLSRLFVTEDPRLKLKKVPARRVRLIERGVAAPGMTREQVIMALGYPPADRTPSLEASTWNYGSGVVVNFGGMQVTSVRQGSGSKSRPGR